VANWVVTVSVGPGLTLSLAALMSADANGRASLCRALRTNETLLTLEIQLCERTGATNVVQVEMERAIEDVAVMLSHNKGLKKIQIQREECRQRLVFWSDHTLLQACN
jgi:hypothetical protein